MDGLKTLPEREQQPAMSSLMAAALSPMMSAIAAAMPREGRPGRDGRPPCFSAYFTRGEYWLYLRVNRVPENQNASHPSWELARNCFHEQSLWSERVTVGMYPTEEQAVAHLEDLKIHFSRETIWQLREVNLPLPMDARHV